MKHFFFLLIIGMALGIVSQTTQVQAQEESLNVTFSKSLAEITNTTTATITWETDIPTGGMITYFYSKDQTQNGHATSSSVYPSRQHRVVLERLIPNGEYTYTLGAFISNPDGTTRSAKKENLTFSTIPFSTPPFVITTDTTTTIIWSTGMPTGLSVKYWKKSAPGETFEAESSQSSPQDSHRIDLKNLTPDTEYAFTLHAFIRTGANITTISNSPQEYDFKTQTELQAKPQISTFRIDGADPYGMQGVPITLSWESQNTTSCTASGDWSGIKEQNGTETITPQKIGYENFYELTCVNASGGQKAYEAIRPLIAAQSKTADIGNLHIRKADVVIKRHDNTAFSFAMNKAPRGPAVLLLFEMPNNTFLHGQYIPEESTNVRVFSFQSQASLKADTAYRFVTTVQSGARETAVAEGTFRTDKVGAITVTTLTASQTLVEPDSAVVLTWTSENADYCTASGGWSGKKDPSGSQTVHPIKDITLYLIECFNANGSGQSTMIDITLRSDEPPPTISFSADRYSIIRGESVKLTWKSTSSPCASSVEVLQNKIFTEAPNHEWKADIKTRKSYGSQTVRPEVTTKYVLQCFRKEKQTIKQLVVTVDKNLAPTDVPAITLSPVTIFDQGNPTVQYMTYEYGNVLFDTLYQSVEVIEKATGIVVAQKNIKRKADDPSKTSTTLENLKPSMAYRYIVTLIDPSNGRQTSREGEFNTADFAESIAPPPTVSLSADRYVITRGDSIRLTWKSTSESKCQSYTETLQNRVFIEAPAHEWKADTDTRLSSGSQTFRPEITTKYFLKCYKKEKFKKEKPTLKTVIVTVDGNLAPYSEPAITLSPITVLDEGTPTRHYLTYEYANVPLNNLYQRIEVIEKVTGSKIMEKTIKRKKDEPLKTSVRIIGLKLSMVYRYTVTLIDPSDGRQALREGEFTILPSEKKNNNLAPTEAQKKESSTPPEETKELDRIQQTEEMFKKAQMLQEQKFDAILAELNELRSTVREQEAELKHLRKLASDIQNLTAAAKEALTKFVAYGVDANTKGLGAGERAAVARSYKQAYGKLPESEQDLSDMIRIANGRFPSKRSAGAENNAKAAFRQIYKRVPNLMTNQNDVAAIMVMAYGLRQPAVNRNLSSEQYGLQTFRRIYRRMPQGPEEWNIMQAITYSGATRKPDSDKDGLADNDEIFLGTDSMNSDSDGDGYSDGIELESGFNPNGEGRLSDDDSWLLPSVR